MNKIQCSVCNEKYLLLGLPIEYIKFMITFPVLNVESYDPGRAFQGSVIAGYIYLLLLKNDLSLQIL